MSTEAAAWAWAEWDAVETRDRLRRGEVSAAEVLEAAVVRAQAAQPLGAVVTPTFERARARAQRPSGPLAGVPFFIKDLVQVEGVRTGWGSRGAGEYVSRHTDPEAVAMERSGLISLGKSATPEFGLTCTTEPLGMSACRNPWNPGHTPGGSSGGAAALVASGVVPLAHASDGGGSIRIPAACCGLVGLKPSRGRLDVAGSQFMPVNLAVNGVLSRSVRDTVAFWRAVEGQLPRRRLPPIGEVQPEPGRALRIGVFVESPTGSPPDPEVRGAVEDAAALLGGLGHEVELIPCPLPRQYPEDFVRYWSFIAFTFVKAGRLMLHRGFDATRCEPWTLELTKRFGKDKWLEVQTLLRLRGMGERWARLLTRFDVIVGPTVGQSAPELGELTSDLPYEVLMERFMKFAPYTGALNIIGAPALSLPLGRSKAGLPIGVHFAGELGADALLLSLGLQLEAARPWPRLAPRSAWQRSPPPRGSAG